MMNNTEITVAIPGKWTDRRELTSALALSSVRNGGFLMAGVLLMDAKKGLHFKAEMVGHDAGLQQVFHFAGRDMLEPQLLDEIGKHTSTVYITTDTTGPASMRALASAVSDVLNAGGLAVYIETTGLAHSKAAWLDMERRADELQDLYTLFVTHSVHEDVYTSFGMKNFGLPDVTAPTTIDPSYASTLIYMLNMYQIDTKPMLSDGETYSIDVDEPYYVMSMMDDARFDEDNYFFNPSGLISLTPLTKKEEKKKRGILKSLFGK